MAKMTPEQQAAYALDYGSRAGLPPAAQIIYDRLLAERSAAAQEPLSAVETEPAGRQVMDDARKALADGRRVLLCRVPMMYDRPITLGSSILTAPSSLIEAIEDLGWRLDQMTWVPRSASGLRPEGIFLFRRTAPHAPGMAADRDQAGTHPSDDLDITF